MSNLKILLESDTNGFLQANIRGKSSSTGILSFAFHKSKAKHFPNACLVDE